MSKNLECFPLYLHPPKPFGTVAQVAKLVDAPSSGGGAARCAGSNPVLGTTKRQTLVKRMIDEGLFFFGDVLGDTSM